MTAVAVSVRIEAVGLFGWYEP